MNTNSICKRCLLSLLTLLIASCSSAPFVQSKDVCNIKRHHQDDIYQVTINDEPINQHYYLKIDAVLIANDLASRKINKCAPRTWQ